MDALVEALEKSGHVWAAVYLAVFVFVARWAGPIIKDLISWHKQRVDGMDARLQLHGDALNEIKGGMVELKDNDKQILQILRPAAKVSGI